MSRLVAAIVFVLIPISLVIPATERHRDPGARVHGREPAREARRSLHGDSRQHPGSRQSDRRSGSGLGSIIDGELAASGAVGVRDVAANAPASDSTVFRIASMSKSFTAFAILKLRDAGKLSLDDAVTKHIPEFAQVKLPTADAPAITIRHLLTHSEGFPEDNPWGDRQLAVPEQTLSTWLTQGLPFSTSPGTAFEYSNYGFALLGRIVTNASGRPYGDYIQDEILKPLQMTSTYWDTRDVPADRLAHGYRRDGDGWAEETPLAHGSFGAMGGLYTSAQDLARYVAFMLSAWPPRDDPDRGPVRRSSVREMQQGQRQSGFGAIRPAPDAPLNARTSSLCLRPGRDAGLPLPAARLARRRAAGLRFDHAVAP